MKLFIILALATGLFHCARPQSDAPPTPETPASETPETDDEALPKPDLTETETEPASPSEEEKAPEIESGSGDATTGWTSGGGGVLGTQDNPWFLSNEDPITYCINIDDETFSESQLTQEQWQQRINTAFEFWVHEFTYAKESFAAFLHEGLYEDAAIFINLDMTGFRYENSCQSTTDIVFQLGVADATQMAFMKERYGSVIAAAVRTSYDPINLRGQGFVYLSPEQGPLQPQVDGLTDHRWQPELQIFEKVLIHELGHVFGVRHLAQTIMDHEYVDKVVTKNSSLASLSVSETSFYDFTANQTFVTCINPLSPPMSWPLDLTWQKAWQALGLDPKSSCAEFVLSPKDWNLAIYAYDSQTSTRGELASLSNFAYVVDCSPLYFRDATITVNLPDEQTIFQTNRERMHGPPVINGISCSQLPGASVVRDPNDPTTALRRAFLQMTFTSERVSFIKHGSEDDLSVGDFDLEVFPMKDQIISF